MQFQKKTRPGSISSIGRLLIKVLLIISFFFILIVLVDKINFPSPNKKIEKKNT